MVHRGKGNKGTFNESGYICPGESILSWCISHRLSSLLHLSYYGGAYASRLVCRALKREQSCWKIQSKERSHDVPARDAKRQKGMKRDTLCRYKCFYFSQRYLLYGRCSSRKKKKERNRIKCDCVTSMSAINRRRSWRAYIVYVSLALLNAHRLINNENSDNIPRNVIIRYA